MGKLTLAGSMPGDNNNGLGPHSTEFIDDYKPGENPRIYNVVARVAVTKIITKTETGEVYPVMRIHHWELVPADHQAAFGEMIGEAFGMRTGAQELPFPDDTVPLKDAFPEPPSVPADDDDDELSQRRGA